MHELKFKLGVTQFFADHLCTFVLPKIFNACLIFIGLVTGPGKGLLHSTCHPSDSHINGNGVEWKNMHFELWPTWLYSCGVIHRYLSWHDLYALKGPTVSLSSAGQAWLRAFRIKEVHAWCPLRMTKCFSRILSSEKTSFMLETRVFTVRTRKSF